MEMRRERRMRGLLIFRFSGDIVIYLLFASAPSPAQYNMWWCWGMGENKETHIRVRKS